MYQNRKSSKLSKYALFLLGTYNLVLGLYLIISRNRQGILIKEIDINTNVQLFSYILCFLGVVLVVNGLYNIIISFWNQKLIFFASVLEFLKGTVILYLEYVNKISIESLPRLYMAIGVMVFALIAMIAVIRTKFSKKYIFFDN